MSLYFQRKRRKERINKQGALIKQALELKAKEAHDNEPKPKKDNNADETEARPKRTSRKKKAEGEGVGD